MYLIDTLENFIIPKNNAKIHEISNAVLIKTEKYGADS